MQTLIGKIKKMQRDQEQLCAECKDKHGLHPDWCESCANAVIRDMPHGEAGAEHD